MFRRGDSPVPSVFALHGNHENDWSAAFAYVMAKSRAFLGAVVADLLPGVHVDLEDVLVTVQRRGAHEGFTDVEVFVPGKGTVVFEAKKGSALPSLTQLRRYAVRCRRGTSGTGLLVALTNVPQPVARVLLPETEVDGVPLVARSWSWAVALAKGALKLERCVETHWLLGEFIVLMEEALGHERTLSNMVYVVSLDGKRWLGWPASSVEIVEQRRQYFYPVDKRWPETPPNYIGFRYRSRLQSIHHVVDFRIVDDLRKEFEGVGETAPAWGPHYLLSLGPAIRPAHEVCSGRRVVRSNRVWCMLDALLTCDTITAALEETERRRSQAEEQQ
jgi:hypothetical protein